MRAATLIFSSILIASTAAAVPAAADIIQLKDGRSISGTLLREGDRIKITSDDGKKIIVQPGDITKVTLTSTVTPAQAAESEWTRDAASIKQASDLQTIIDLHQQFLQKYPDQSISKEVASSLQEYLKLARQDAVKFRGRWMPRAQVEVVEQQWADRAKSALDLYKANNLRGAFDAARSALRDDSLNPDALTLAGLAAYRLNSLNVARDYFTTLADDDPTDVLAENNLAVILFQQHRQPESLSYYARALQASPQNRFVADNVEEALHAYIGSADIPPYQDLVRLFSQSEPRIETEMARHGLYRYGSTWVPLPIFDRLNANIQSIKNAMAQLDAQYKTAKMSAGAIDAAIAKADADYNTTATNIAYLNSVIATSYGDVSSFISQRDALVADLQRIEANRNSLLAQKQAAQATASGAPDQAERLKAALAAAEGNRFTGTQRILDWGEADNLPPPSIVSLPSPVPVTIATPAPVAVPPSSDNQTSQTTLTSGYQQATTPIGLIPIPIPIPIAIGGGHHHDHDGGGNSGGRGHAGDGDLGGFTSTGVESPVSPIGTPIPIPIGSPVPPIGSPITPIRGDAGSWQHDGGYHQRDSAPAAAPIMSPVAPSLTGNQPQAPAMSHGSGGGNGSSSNQQSSGRNGG